MSTMCPCLPMSILFLDRNTILLKLADQWVPGTCLSLSPNAGIIGTCGHAHCLPQCWVKIRSIIYPVSNFTFFTIFQAQVWLSFCEFRCLSSSGSHACLTNALPVELFLAPLFLSFEHTRTSFYREPMKTVWPSRALHWFLSHCISLLNIWSQLTLKYPINLFKKKKKNPLSSQCPLQGTLPNTLSSASALFFLFLPLPTSLLPLPFPRET